MHLKEFTASVVADSLFAAEGLDLVSAHKSVESIERAITELEQELGKSFLCKLFLIRYPLAKFAFPLPFLRSFLAAESARRTFTSERNEKNAEYLLLAWNTAAEEYSKSVRRYERVH